MAQWNHQGDEGEGNAYDADSQPVGLGPHVSGTERTERTTDEIDRHEDGVGTVGSLRNLLQAAALIAELLTLQSDIYQDDGCDESCIGVAEEEGYCFFECKVTEKFAVSQVLRFDFLEKVSAFFLARTLLYVYSTVQTGCWRAPLLR